jgi:hypothetical protein
MLQCIDPQNKLPATFPQPSRNQMAIEHHSSEIVVQAKTSFNLQQNQSFLA